MIDIINESGQRAAEIVENMLSFARKSDAILSTYHPVQLMDRILEIAATDYDMKKQYDFKAIKIVKEYEQDLPVIPCEGAQIQQVLLNILRNGSQAMQTAKTESPRFILRIFRKGEPEMVHMEIEDNGREWMRRPGQRCLILFSRQNRWGRYRPGVVRFLFHHHQKS